VQNIFSEGRKAQLMADSALPALLAELVEKHRETPYSDRLDRIERLSTPAASTISRQGTPVETLDQALLTVKAFSDLMNYGFYNKGHGSIGADSVEDSLKNYSLNVVTRDSTWIISIALGEWRRINRYEFQVTKTGAISIRSCQNICRHIMKLM
jgi:hypothetical protein